MWLVGSSRSNQAADGANRNARETDTKTTAARVHVCVCACDGGKRDKREAKDTAAEPLLCPPLSLVRLSETKKRERASKNTAVWLVNQTLVMRGLMSTLIVRTPRAKHRNSGRNFRWDFGVEGSCGSCCCCVAVSLLYRRCALHRCEGAARLVEEGVGMGIGGSGVRGEAALVVSREQEGSKEIFMARRRYLLGAWFDTRTHTRVSIDRSRTVATSTTAATAGAAGGGTRGGGAGGATSEE